AASCSVARLTTVDSANLVYFVGSAGYQEERGLSLAEAQARIAQEQQLPTYREAMNPWVAQQSAAAMDAQLRQAAPRVIGMYPRSLAVALCKGVAKACISHNVEELAELLGLTWEAPGLESTMRGDAASIRRLGANSPILVVAFAWQMLHAVLAQGLA